MLTENTDERYDTADIAIRDAFFILLKEKSPDKITVSDIVKRAGIVRSTFYNHYENVSALISAIEDKTVEDIFGMMEHFHIKDSAEMCRSYYISLCRYIESNPVIADLLKSPGGSSFLEKSIMMFHRYVSEVTSHVILTNHSREDFSYMIACTIGGTIGVLHKWANEGFSVPADKIADILARSFMAGMSPYKD